MSRVFDANVANRLSASFAPSSLTFTLSLWVKADGGAGAQCPISFSSTGGDSMRLDIQFQSSNDPTVVALRNGTTVNYTSSAVNFDPLDDNAEIGVWKHIAVTSSTTDMHVFIDGTKSATTSHSLTEADYLGWDTCVIGNFFKNGTTFQVPFDGKIAEVAFWDGTELSDANITSLAGGASPLDTGTISTAADQYNRLEGTSSPEPSETSGQTFTITGTVAGDNLDDPTVTNPPSGDTTAPTVPTGLTATAASSSVIDLSWTASTDAVGVVGYYVYRDTVQIADVTSGTTYQDTGLNASTSYDYNVAAYDAAANVSAQSTTATETTAANSGSGASTGGAMRGVGRGIHIGL